MEQGMPPVSTAPQQGSSARRWIIIGAVALLGCCILVGIVMAVSGAALGALGGIVGGLASTDDGLLSIACIAEAPDLGVGACRDWAQGVVDNYPNELSECKQGAVTEDPEEGQLTDFQLVFNCLQARDLGPQQMAP